MVSVIVPKHRGRGKPDEAPPLSGRGMMIGGSLLFLTTAMIDMVGDSFTLFVYGTLMRGGVRHRVLAGQRFLGEARTLPRYALFDLGAYPGLVRREADGRSVFGELYEVAVSLIERLDRIEGAPDLYRLEPILIEGHSGDVFTYFYQQDTRGCSLCANDRWPNEAFQA